jgi:hypothetical protein
VLNTDAENPCLNNEMPLTKAPINQIMKTLQPDIKTLDNLAKWCAKSKGELQKYIAWYFKRFADFTDYITHN